MAEIPPFRLLRPVRLTGATVFSAPHSGRHYPEALVGRSRLSRRALRSSEDVLVDELFAAAPRHGVPLIAATLPRAWLDLNRAPNELDPALIADVPRRAVSQRVAAGLGVIPRVVAEGMAIYRGRLSRAEAEARIRAVHRPYHAALSGLIEEARGRFGRALLLDCHSMPSEALKAAPRVQGRRPEVVLGDRFGGSASPEVVAAVRRAFERAGFVVARNAPFAGGYITRHYGRPAEGVEAIQIELDRGLYLDERTLEPLPGFEALRARLEEVIAELAQILPDARPLAAE